MQKLTNEKARELLKELQYAKVQMGGQLSIRDEYFKQALERLPRWIACNEQMPDFDIDVMVYCADTEEQFVAYHRNDGLFHYATYAKGNKYINIACQPTHWMPLPEAPL